MLFASVGLGENSGAKNGNVLMLTFLTAFLSVFKGPRVLFPDGFDSQRQLRSAYFDEPAAFTVSIKAIGK